MTRETDDRPALDREYDPIPVVVTVRQASLLLRLDPRSVRELFKSGDIVGNKHGHAIRLSTASVLAWARGQLAG